MIQPFKKGFLSIHDDKEIAYSEGILEESKEKKQEI